MRRDTADPSSAPSSAVASNGTSCAKANTRPGARGLRTSIIICCYSDQRSDDVRRAIGSALAQEPPADEILVVVDHNQRLRDRLSVDYPGIQVIANVEGRGLSGARNTGIAAALGDLLVFLDDDAAADPAMLSHLTLCAEDPGVLGAMARILPDWQEPARSWFPAEFLWVVGCTYAGLQPGPVRNLIGAAMCVRRSVFDEVGGFSERLGRTRTALPLGCEETELCIRANQARPQGTFRYVPEAICRHKVGRARMSWRYFATRCFAEGLSKARLTALTRSGPVLSSERAYVRTTLPRGVRRGLADFGSRGDASGLLRAGALVAGLACTVAGYAAGTGLRLCRAARSDDPTPVRLVPAPQERGG